MADLASSDRYLHFQYARTFYFYTLAFDADHPIATLIIALERSRTGFTRRSNTVINRLLRTFVQTGEYLHLFSMLEISLWFFHYGSIRPVHQSFCYTGLDLLPGQTNDYALCYFWSSNWAAILKRKLIAYHLIRACILTCSA